MTGGGAICLPWSPTVEVDWHGARLAVGVTGRPPLDEGVLGPDRDDERQTGEEAGGQGGEHARTLGVGPGAGEPELLMSGQ